MINKKILCYSFFFVALVNLSNVTYSINFASAKAFALGFGDGITGSLTNFAYFLLSKGKSLDTTLPGESFSKGKNVGNFTLKAVGIPVGLGISGYVLYKAAQTLKKEAAPRV